MIVQVEPTVIPPIITSGNVAECREYHATQVIIKQWTAAAVAEHCPSVDIRTVVGSHCINTSLSSSTDTNTRNTDNNMDSADDVIDTSGICDIYCVMIASVCYDNYATKVYNKQYRNYSECMTTCSLFRVNGTYDTYTPSSINPNDDPLPVPNDDGDTIQCHMIQLLNAAAADNPSTYYCSLASGYTPFSTCIDQGVTNRPRPQPFRDDTDAATDGSTGDGSNLATEQTNLAIAIVGSIIGVIIAAIVGLFVWRWHKKRLLAMIHVRQQQMATHDFAPLHDDGDGHEHDQQHSQQTNEVELPDIALVGMEDHLSSSASSS
jgi:hypothetical protein